MASELKPCPFCGSNQLSFRSTPDMDTDGKFHRISCNECGASSRATFAMDACPLFYEELRNAWNTRPAPAATDTGLKTVVLSSHGELVTRSQAEELLAAKDAELRDALIDVRKYILRSEAAQKELHSEKEARVGWMNIATQEQKRANKAEADNAAKDARIDRLVDDYANLVQETVDQTEQIADLEAKLAAAEKALEGLREKGRKVLDVLKAWEDDSDLVNSGKIVADFRAMLGGKPS